MRERESQLSELKKEKVRKEDNERESEIELHRETEGEKNDRRIEKKSIESGRKRVCGRERE